MSVTEEDTELRDLVVQTLENNGVLGKLKAQLRASVFLALDEEDKKNPLINDKLRTFTQTAEGRQVVSLFREFLKFFNLEYTLAVFDPEADVVFTDTDRESLVRELGLKDVGETTKRPIICNLLKNIGSSPIVIEADLDKLLPEKVLSKKPDPQIIMNETHSELEKQKSQSRRNSEDSSETFASGKNPLSGDSVEAGKAKEDEYDDDFYNSNKSMTPRDKKSKFLKSSKSPRVVGDDDDIEEDILEEEEDGSSMNRSDSISKDEDMTSDRTISPTEKSTAGDYVEDILKP